ncbi:hypothetical protein [Actinocrispum wychmicini]|uniref:hypothetical protein n=1 Tax=Actinocrispum wychmicini TaxID=1213861 RepID=UPI001FB76C69|nr:hypothetical protein [Actinocrispum wychmicini]
MTWAMVMPSRWIIPENKVEPLVLVGPDTTEYLAVYREQKLSVSIALGAFS